MPKKNAASFRVLHTNRGSDMKAPLRRAALSAQNVKLPAPQRDRSKAIEELLRQRRSVREFSSKPLELWQISQLAWAAQGVTDPEGLRTAPSAGALYPLEIYMAAGNVRSLTPGIYRYDPHDNDLTIILQDDKRRELCAAALSQSSVQEAPAVFIISAVYERTTAKYGERGIRYVHMEAGHAAQNLILQVTALGLSSVVIGAFSDAKVRRILALKNRETPLYLIPVGSR
jgi:SagB-type dehydrogenase family enzyme